jgi:hypothetical protein
MPEVTKHLNPTTIDQLDLPEGYLGSADAFRLRQTESTLPVKKPAKKPMKKPMNK